MAFKTQYSNQSNKVGVFSKLTNAYCLLGTGGSDLFYDTYEMELEIIMPVIHTSIGGYSSIGRIIAANKKGLLLPFFTTDTELRNIKNMLPDNVRVRRDKGNMNALGNVIACNDTKALVHPNLDKATVELLANTLDVQVFRRSVAGHVDVGAYAVLNNHGVLVHSKTSVEEQEELSSLLNLPVTAGTVSGSDEVAAGMVVNEWYAFCADETTSEEITVIESVFKI